MDSGILRDPDGLDTEDVVPDTSTDPEYQIETLNLSARPYHCLIRQGITTVDQLRELLQQPYDVLRSIKALGAKSAMEIEQAMRTRGLWDGKRASQNDYA